jgi:hypothetical protein
MPTGRQITRLQDERTLKGPKKRDEIFHLKLATQSLPLVARAFILWLVFHPPIRHEAGCAELIHGRIT